ncbi:MAG: hypothetical protein K2H67_02925, partial [Treponemataceae bacterium]|nr:hypothetical protein [Treponemataceae bacterium]
MLIKKRAGHKARLNFMTKLAKKFYVGKPILHCLTQNIGLIALFPHKNFKAKFQKRNGAKVIVLGLLRMPFEMRLSQIFTSI